MKHLKLPPLSDLTASAFLGHIAANALGSDVESKKKDPQPNT